MQYTINIDWLELCLKGKLDKRNEVEEGLYKYDNITFKLRKGVKTRHFANIYDVYYKTVLIGDICSDPHSSALDENLKKFKFSNRFLYEESPLLLLQSLIDCTYWTVNNISRLDIALDLQRFKNMEVQDFFQSFYSGQIRRKGTAAKFSLYGEGANIMGLRFGAVNGDRSCVVYNKSKELVKSNKQYIKEIHNAAFGSGHADVYRVELRLKNRELQKLLDLETGEMLFSDLGNALSPETLARVFRAEFENYMKFIPNVETSNVSRLEVIELIDFEKITHLNLKRFTTKQPNKLYRAKVAIKSLIEEYYISHSMDCLFQAKYYIETYQLHEAVIKRLPYWLKDMEQIKDLGTNYRDLNTFFFSSPERENFLKLAAEPAYIEYNSAKNVSAWHEYKSYLSAQKQSPDKVFWSFLPVDGRYNYTGAQF